MKLSPRRLLLAIGIAIAAGTIWGLLLRSYYVGGMTAGLTVFACHQLGEEHRWLVLRWCGAAVATGAMVAIVQRFVYPIIAGGPPG